MNRAQSTLVYATATARAADTAQGEVVSAGRCPGKHNMEKYVTWSAKHTEALASKDAARGARARANAAAWEATVAFCNQNGVALGGSRRRRG